MVRGVVGGKGKVCLGESWGGGKGWYAFGFGLEALEKVYEGLLLGGGGVGVGLRGGEVERRFCVLLERVLVFF